MRCNWFRQYAESKPSICRVFSTADPPIVSLPLPRLVLLSYIRHAHDPKTGNPARDLKLYREVTDRIRDSEVDVVLNLTAGMGGDIVFGGVENPFPAVIGTDMIGAPDDLNIFMAMVNNVHDDWTFSAFSVGA